MISDEAVEAAARVLCRKAHIDKYGTDAWRDGELDTRLDQYWPCWSTEARAALEAALPHLLASQGCGTGHSADAGPCPRSPVRWQTMDRTGLIETARAWADQNMAIHDKRTDLAQSLREAAFYRADALFEYAAHIKAGNFDAVRPWDGGEAVHSPAEREGSRDEPRTEYVAVTEAVRLAEKQMTSLREALATHPQKGGEG